MSLKNYRCFLSLFIGQNYCFNDVAQLYLMFQPIYYTLKTLSSSEEVI